MRTIMERLVNQWIHGLRRSDGLPCVRLRRIPSSCYIYMALWILSSLIAVCFAQGATELPPKMFTQQPQAGSAQMRGNTKVLLCFASGTPSPVYRWKKDGVYMTSENLTDSALRIQNIQRPDAGYYQCVASNTHGAILSNEVFVRVAYMVPFALVGEQEQNVDQGQAKVINLPPIDSYPAPTISWHKSYNQPVPSESPRYHVTLNHQLVILETRLNSDNNNLYKASALNGYTGDRSDSQTFVLQVQNVGSLSNDIPPAIVIPPSPTTAVQGDDVSVALECVANARPLNFLSLRWYKHSADGSRTEIKQDDIKYLLSVYRRVLTIKNPVIGDSGSYECEAVFQRLGNDPLPSVSASANLTVLEKPNFVSPPPAEINQDVDTTVVIECQAVGSQPLTVQWYRNAVPIQDLQDTRYTTLENGNLQIDGAIPSHSGMYQCFVLNEVGSINDATWVRILSSAPKIIQGPPDKIVVAGDSVRFPCQVSGAPRPDITWSRVTSGGALEVFTSANPRIQVVDNELLILQTEVSDTGTYICNASNSQGAVIAKAALTVTLRTRIIAPPQAASVIKGSRTVLQCTVTADPSVTVVWRWFQNDVAIPSADVRRQVHPFDGTLEIKAVRNSDIGTYKCHVSSEGGNDTASADIRVIELPYPPVITSVNLNTESIRAVDVHWNPGFNGNSPINKFTIQFRQVPADSNLLPDDGWQVAHAALPPDTSSYTVLNLSPAMSYQFRVSAVNDVGEGDASLPSDVIEMPQQPPSGPPRGVVGSPRSESSIIITWQAPDADKWNGALLGYMISYKPSGYPDSTLEHENITSYDIHSLMYELKGLIIFQEYEIAVAAYNRKGVGVYSDYVSIRTQEGIPTAPPTDIQATPINSTCIKVTWMPPDSQFINGINQGYRIYAQRIDTEDSQLEIPFPSDTSNMLGLQTGFLLELRKFTEYRITVLCFTSKGNGPLSSAVNAVTLEDVPDAVVHLRFNNILDTSLGVLWSPPLKTNGILTGYSLSYMRKDQTITKVTEELAPNVHNYTIRGLTATTTYTIEVTAHTRVGPGPVSRADIASGVPPVAPEPPRNLALTNIRARTVMLQFVPGFSGYTSISKWIIEAQSNDNEDPLSWSSIYEATEPSASSLTVRGLHPYTRYRLRMIAENIANQSRPSEATRWFETIQAEPSSPPADVSVRAYNETAMRVRWTPLPARDWNGEQRGYRVEYTSVDASLMPSWKAVNVDSENANSFMLAGLEEWTEYQVRVAAFNKVGHSADSPVVKDSTREAAPTAGPSNITASAVNSTSIYLTWGEVPKRHQNGLIRGYKVKYSSVQENIGDSEVVIESNQVFEVYLTDLRKYVWYDLQLLAYTRIGDGSFSNPPLSIRTDEDKPGPPSAVYFPDVTNSAVKVVWEPPREPNGVIRGYRVAYGQRVEPPSEQTYTIVDDTLNKDRRSYEVFDLMRNTYYVFSITAETRLGWGVPYQLEVYTIINRRVPNAPSQPRFGLSQIGDRWVTISWTPGSDGYGPIRNYTVQVQRSMQPYLTLRDYIPSGALEHNITDLRPNTRYKFRVAASNDIGLGPFSAPSEEATTKQAAPESSPLDLKVIPMTTSSVLVTWQPPPDDTWNGPLMGYNVEYREVDTGSAWRSDKLFNAALTSMTVYSLQLFKTYEFRICAFNSLGQSEWSPQSVIYLEIVPLATPLNVRVETRGSTEIMLFWDPPPVDTQNGDLLGYKVFFWVSGHKDSAELQTVSASKTSTLLSGLQMYTEYAAILLAYNAAGDGPNTTVPVVARTSEGVPSAPGQIHFMIAELNAVNVSWSEPATPNGLIELYEVSYFMDSLVDGESRSVQVKLAGDRHYYVARELTPAVEYVFQVRAKTGLAWGPHLEGNITVKPLVGAPDKPTKPRATRDGSTLVVVWENGLEGAAPIAGYIIQAREQGEDVWETSMIKMDAESEVVLSFLNFKAKTEYQFRVLAYNNVYGISVPSEPSEYIETPDIHQKPFYKQWWFLVIAALVGLILIIIVASLLCLTGRNSRLKYKAVSQGANSNTSRKRSVHVAHSCRSSQLYPSIPRTTVQLSENGAIVHDEEGFATFEMRRSQRGTLRSTRPKAPKPPPAAIASASNMVDFPVYANPRIPPRPSPGSINYSDDEGKFPDDNSSSLSEKPSDISSSEESDDDVKPPPPPEFNHTYVNGDVQQSWQRQHSVPSSQYSGAYAYPESEPDSSHYGVALNGGHVIMNNMAGSRAPLPGFSSFV